MAMKFKSKMSFSEKHEVKEHQFPPCQERFNYITVMMTIGFMNPYSANPKLRFIGIACTLVVTIPLMFMIVFDIWRCWMRRDIFNIIRHSTIAGPLAGTYVKMLIMFVKRDNVKYMLDEINSDFEAYNNLPTHYKDLAVDHIKNIVFFTKGIWGGTISICAISFPSLPIIFTVYSYYMDDKPVVYMVHEVVVPFMKPEARFESPLYDILFIYEVSLVMICLVNYTGFDGFFGLVTGHACLKMDMYCQRLEDAFRAGREEMWKEVVGFIEDQKKLFRYTEIIQDTFNVWLGTIGVCTMIQIGSLLYHVFAGFGFDLKYFMFSITTVVHIFLPCYYSSKVKSTSEHTATRIYCSGWEGARSPRAWRVMPFLLARAQVPKRITAFYMFEYGMEFFAFILRTSYSTYTLLRS
uniref:Odorant receptor n=1 Tax=Heortia vitessoides TaxID=1557813 RepID=A0A978W729_9NEOP|nr:odorant receptor 32 [Heortia vitessoides]